MLEERNRICQKKLNGWMKTAINVETSLTADARLSKTLAYKHSVCESCMAKEYDMDIEAFRAQMEGYFGIRPCLGL